MRQIADHLGPGKKQDPSMVLRQGRYNLRSTVPTSATQTDDDDSVRATVAHAIGLYVAA